MMTFERTGEWKRIVREWLASTLPYVDESLLGNFLSITGKCKLTIGRESTRFTKKLYLNQSFYFLVCNLRMSCQDFSLNES